ncbi:hypothetical protein C8J56DRAFT_34201 [Mycena floridula]|nr:hypothetical protein C8J56DRAFT_34201 [Mycena floridula]
MPSCRLCSRHCSTQQGIYNHTRDVHPKCIICHNRFSQQDDLDDHYYHDHHFCPDCNRQFENKTNLNAHLSSTFHKGRTYGCFFDECPKAFVSHSAMILHLETGTCCSQITRQDINRLVSQCDDEGRLGEHEMFGAAYSCPACGGRFNSLGGLAQHSETSSCRVKQTGLEDDLDEVLGRVLREYDSYRGRYHY